ncbi:MAG: AAA family ATPase [Phycisphaerales bacterium]
MSDRVLGTGYGPGGGDEAPMLNPAPAPEHQGNALKVLHRLLRGRLVLTIALGVIGAIGGAVGGFLSTEPKFETRGMISIQPVLPFIMDRSVNAEPLPFFNSFVNRQMALLRSPRVLAKAVESTDWLNLGIGSGPAAEEFLRRNIKVEPAPASQELLFVTCVHEDQRVSSTAVLTVINAYSELYKDEGSINAGVISSLRTEQSDSELEIRNLEKDIRDTVTAGNWPTDDLTELHHAEFRRMMELEQQVMDLEQLLRERGAMPKPPGEGAVGPPEPIPAPPVPPADPTPIEIAAAGDMVMDQLLGRRAELEQRLATLTARGLGTNHPSVKDVVAEQVGVEAGIASRVKTWVEAQKAGAGAGVRPGMRVIESIEELQNRYVELKKWFEARNTRLAEINVARDTLDKLRAKLTRQRTELDTVNARLNSLERESQVSDKIAGRVKVESRGDTPPFPSVDKRKQFAAAGFIGGGGLPVGLMLLIGFMDRRFRYSDEAKDLACAPPVLGLLPVLPKELEDAEQRAIAAHCVHQVRLLLQIAGAPTGRRVYAVTSPTAGDGKTSLALSLGLSFSASGSRTLLIDFDMIGTGLTSNLKLNNGHGLAAALKSGSVNGSVVPVPPENLWLIPSRHEDDHYVNRLSTSVVRRLLDQVRDQYDVILIDTGPILGSLEAALVCAASDAVVMVVGRGQRREHVEQAFERVAAVGGRIAGMVFNRATPGDFKRSVTSTSMRSIPKPAALGDASSAPSARRLGDAGPIVRTVVLELDSAPKRHASGAGPDATGTSGA